MTLKLALFKAGRLHARTQGRSVNPGENEKEMSSLLSFPSSKFEFEDAFIRRKIAKTPWSPRTAMWRTHEEKDAVRRASTQN